MLFRARALLVCSLVVLGSLVAPGAAVGGELPPGGTFTDDDGNVHEGHIEAIAAEGITRGCTDDGERYCPERVVKRGEMAAFLRRALGLPASTTDHFDDDDGHLFEADINAIADAGITTGCGNGTGFCPDGSVTRGEMAAFLRRAKDLPASSTDHFSDDDGTTFEADINAIAEAGITKGCNPPDNTAFCARADVTRDQMASFLGRLLGLQATPPPQRVAPESMTPREAIAEWFPNNTEDALTVARCESSLNPRALSPNGRYHGLFQIADFHAPSFRRVTGQRFEDAWYISYYNAQYARHLYEGNGWRPWTCKP